MQQSSGWLCDLRKAMHVSLMAKVVTAFFVGQPTPGPLAKTSVGLPIKLYTANVTIVIGHSLQLLGKARLECCPCQQPFLYGSLVTALAKQKPSTVLRWLEDPNGLLVKEWTQILPPGQLACGQQSTSAAVQRSKATPDFKFPPQTVETTEVPNPHSS